MNFDDIQKYTHFSIFGAHVVAYGAYCAIKKLYGRSPDCFIVTNPEWNLDSVDGIPVRPLETVSRDSLIVVGVTELTQREITALLEDKGYHHVLPLGNRAEYRLMRAYFDAIGLFPPISTDGTGQAADLGLYEVRNHRDTPLARHPALFPYEYPIQAGAARSEKRVADILDNQGENISAKNVQYCEMTASYWVWKHTHHAWTGIEHYRRHLLLKPEMLHDGIDAVLPLPFVCWPNTLVHLCWFVGGDVRDAMLKALKTLHPEEFPGYMEILNGHWQYPCNMLAAKKSVYDDYCAWFFRITEYIETMGDAVPAISETRALSYVAEVLTSLYFLSHRDTLCVRHVEKEIYI